MNALWTLARPRLAAYVLSLPVVGFAWAHWDRALSLRGEGDLALVAASWLALHAGTLWLNAALDRDEGAVLFGRSVPPPPGIARWGYAGLAVCVGLALLANPLAGLCASICALLSVLYSHPATRWKGHPLGGPLINVVGYGLLSTLAGWSAAGVSANPRTTAMWLLTGCGVSGCYFAAQAFQRDEDAARGYRTLVVTHGARVTLGVARGCMTLGVAGGVALALFGWLPRVCLLVAPTWWWADVWLKRWAALPDGGTAAHAQTLLRRIRVLLIIAFAAISVEYVRGARGPGPVAGLSTAAGHPAELIEE